AARLQARGIDLAVVALPALGRPETLISSLDLPAYARVGDAVPSTAHVYSTDATSGTLRIDVDGTTVGRQPILLVPGDNPRPLPQPADVAGFHRVDVTLEGVQDTRPENNTAGATLVVKPPPHILVLEDRAGEAKPLADALAAQRMTVEVHQPSV